MFDMTYIKILKLYWPTYWKNIDQNTYLKGGNMPNIFVYKFFLSANMYKRLLISKAVHKVFVLDA